LKIGLTSKAVQSKLGISIPTSSVLLDDMVYENGAIIPKYYLVQPCIELEIAFVMKLASLARIAQY
jgi:2-oxo-hept-3-ene-1,7-dioate hydratase